MWTLRGYNDASQALGSGMVTAYKHSQNKTVTPHLLTCKRTQTQCWNPDRPSICTLQGCRRWTTICIVKLLSVVCLTDTVYWRHYYYYHHVCMYVHTHIHTYEQYLIFSSIFSHLSLLMPLNITYSLSKYMIIYCPLSETMASNYKFQTISDTQSLLTIQ